MKKQRVGLREDYTIKELRDILLWHVPRWKSTQCETVLHILRKAEDTGEEKITKKARTELNTLIRHILRRVSRQNLLRLHCADAIGQKRPNSGDIRLQIMETLHRAALEYCTEKRNRENSRCT
ncbi:MAG: hypothetical protein ACQEQV_11310 [Fibrobacterota bacterium]